MRLGAYDARLAFRDPWLREGSTAPTGDQRKRHRHRYEVNNDYRMPRCKPGGCPLLARRQLDGKLVEMIELADHPWFVASQSHPEFKSRPTAAHPLFASFIEAGAIRAAGPVCSGDRGAGGGWIAVRHGRFAGRRQRWFVPRIPGQADVAGSRDLYLFAGPCVLEDEGLNLAVARGVASAAGQSGAARSSSRPPSTRPTGPGSARRGVRGWSGDSSCSPPCARKPDSPS